MRSLWFRRLRVGSPNAAYRVGGLSTHRVASRVSLGWVRVPQCEISHLVALPKRDASRLGALYLRTKEAMERVSATGPDANRRFPQRVFGFRLHHQRIGKGRVRARRRPVAAVSYFGGLVRPVAGPTPSARRRGAEGREVLCHSLWRWLVRELPLGIERTPRTETT